MFCFPTSQCRPIRLQLLIRRNQLRALQARQRRQRLRALLQVEHATILDTRLTLRTARNGFNAPQRAMLKVNAEMDSTGIKPTLRATGITLLTVHMTHNSIK